MPDPKIVAVTQIASHPSLDAVRDGVYAGLAERGWVEGENVRFIFRNANRDPSLALPIAQAFAAQKVDVIVPITTPSALAAAQATSEIPIVFGGVTDPVGIGLVGSLEQPGGNITGTSDRWPFDKQLELFVTLLPSMDTIGMLYSPSDDVSAIAVRELRRLCPEAGIELKTVPISSSQDIYRVARQLLTDVDAIYSGLDTLVVENLESVMKAAEEAGKPVLAGDEGSVTRGALATFGISMVDLGKETGFLVDRVLRGEAPGEMDVVVIKDGYPIVNRDALRRFRITLPSAIEANARFVGGSG